jgi:hypothetical protein
MEYGDFNQTFVLRWVVAAGNAYADSSLANYDEFWMVNIESLASAGRDSHWYKWPLSNTGLNLACGEQDSIPPPSRVLPKAQVFA